MEELPIINRAYESYKAIVAITTKLDKHYRYGLGESLETSCLNLLESLIMAKHAPKPTKTGYIIKSMAQLEIAIMKTRLLLELRLANETNIYKLQAKLSEIGRMLGGWLKSVT